MALGGILFRKTRGHYMTPTQTMHYNPEIQHGTQTLVGPTFYLLVHVQIGPEKKITVAMKNIDVSKIKTIAHFEDFYISIYQIREHLPPMGIFVRGTRNPNPKI